MAKVMANTGRPRITSISSSNELGTSSETTSRVMAKPNTASLNASRRVTSCSAAAIAADSSASGQEGRGAPGPRVTLALRALELLHERHERVDPLLGERVVDR